MYDTTTHLPLQSYRIIARPIVAVQSNGKYLGILGRLSLGGPKFLFSRLRFPPVQLRGVRFDTLF